jgi:hypothetical protein
MKIQKQEDERNKAMDLAKKEKAQIEAYNRFTELQTEYGQQFTYQHSSFELRTKHAPQTNRSHKTIDMNCQVSYLPFEGRFDKESFELFLRSTVPKELLMIGNAARLQETREFLEANFLPVTIHQAPYMNKGFKVDAEEVAEKVLVSKKLEHVNCYKM